MFRRAATTLALLAAILTTTAAPALAVTWAGTRTSFTCEWVWGWRTGSYWYCGR